jgi:glycosylphosphatidylinositol transamidase
MEGVLRSLNNLLEKFHHSFWFYIMADADRYINIAIYIGPAILLIAPLIVKVFKNDSRPREYFYG